MTEGEVPNGLAGQQERRSRSKSWLLIPTQPAASTSKTLCVVWRLSRGVNEKSNVSGLVEFLKDNPVHVALFGMETLDQNLFGIPPHNRPEKTPGGAKVKIIVVGEEFEQAKKDQGTKAGVSGFIVKPFDMRTVEMAMMDAIRPPDASKIPIPDALRQILNKFRQVSLFFGFADVELIRMLKICKSRRIPAGNYLFKEGDMGDSLFVVIAGQIDITKKQDGASRCW